MQQPSPFNPWANIAHRSPPSVVVDGSESVHEQLHIPDAGARVVHGPQGPVPPVKVAPGSCISQPQRSPHRSRRAGRAAACHVPMPNGSGTRTKSSDTKAIPRLAALLVGRVRWWCRHVHSLSVAVNPGCSFPPAVGAYALLDVVASELASHRPGCTLT